tara:strand:+ start:36 stop:257 length:222 start_codon:yes stop_codon:yes gene_type:complete
MPHTTTTTEATDLIGAQSRYNLNRIFILSTEEGYEVREGQWAVGCGMISSERITDPGTAHEANLAAIRILTEA